MNINDFNQFYYKNLSNDKIINIIVYELNDINEQSNKFKEDDFIIVNYDLILNPPSNSTEAKIKDILLKKYGIAFFNSFNKNDIKDIKHKYTLIYKTIIDYLKNENKQIIIEGSNLRHVNELKGKLIALLPTIETCVERLAENQKIQNPSITIEELELYKKIKREEITKMDTEVKNTIYNVENSIKDKENKKFDITEMQNILEQKAKYYLQIITNEYGKYFNNEQINLLKDIIQKDIIVIEKDTESYENKQALEILNNPDLSGIEKVKELNNIQKTLGHGGRVFNDNKIHFYPSILTTESQAEAINLCEEILIHEILHFFIRPKVLNVNPKTANNITEALVDMLTRDIHQKYNLFPNYNSNYAKSVIIARGALDKMPENERLFLIFNGNCSMIYQYLQDYKVNIREDERNFDLFVKEITANFLPSEKDERRLYNFSANYKNIEESVEAIKKFIETNMPERVNELDEILKKYNLSQAKTLEDEPLKRVLKKPDNYGFLNTSIIITVTILIIIITAIIAYLFIK